MGEQIARSITDPAFMVALLVAVAVFATAMTLLPAGVLNSIGSAVRPVMPRRLRHVPFGDKLHKLAEVVGAPGMETLYLTLMSHWKRPTDLVIRGREPVTAITGIVN